MDARESLKALRTRIDEIDGKLAPLFGERMELSKQAAAIKASGNMPILDETRERQVVERAVGLTDESLRGEVSLLMRAILALSRERQRQLLLSAEEPLLPAPRKPVQGALRCAYQGVPGAWSEQALIKLFPEAERLPEDYFEDVFIAVRERRADYGVVAIENSKTGAIGETYDLLRRYGCFIVGRTWMDISQCLLAREGVALTDIREVFSHPEGFKQCGHFLRRWPWDLTACRNTAVAAQQCAESDNRRTAAIGSRFAAELHGLNVLVPDIMDAADNRTSFVVIARSPEYDEHSDLISLTFSTAHRSGALCEALLPFMASRLNLMRIESRPAGPDKFRFFAEVQGNVTDPAAEDALRHVAAACDYFEVIGCYRLS